MLGKNEKIGLAMIVIENKIKELTELNEEAFIAGNKKKSKEIQADKKRLEEAYAILNLFLGSF